MQIAAAELYPGFTRPLFLKGYRYNMHLCPYAMLIEVGAQTNTYEEAYLAMEPLANILSFVLLGMDK
jgi:stage II sporulation protein P